MRSKGRNSVTAIYLYVLNLEPHHRSKCDSFLTIQLFKSYYTSDFEIEDCFNELVIHINDLIENGIDLSIGKSYPVRMVQYQADKKEVNLLMRLSVNFCSRYFSPYCKITTKERRSAKFALDLLPQKFGIRDQEAYENDVRAKESGLESHGVKEDSCLNRIKFFHTNKIGMMIPCLHHDIFAGFGREDIAFVVNDIINRKFISKELMVKKCHLFKFKLFGSDRRSWYPKLRSDSFKVPPCPTKELYQGDWLISIFYILMRL